MKSRISLKIKVEKDLIIINFKNDPLIQNFFKEFSGKNHTSTYFGYMYSIFEWSVFPPRWQTMLNEYNFKTKLINKTCPNMSLLRSVNNEIEVHYSGLQAIDDFERFPNLFTRYHNDFIKNIMIPYQENIKLALENKEKLQNGMYLDKKTNRWTSLLKYEVITV